MLYSCFLLCHVNYLIFKLRTHYGWGTFISPTIMCSQFNYQIIIVWLCFDISAVFAEKKNYIIIINNNMYYTYGFFKIIYSCWISVIHTQTQVHTQGSINAYIRIIIIYIHVWIVSSKELVLQSILSYVHTDTRTFTRKHNCIHMHAYRVNVYKHSTYTYTYTSTNVCAWVGFLRNMLMRIIPTHVSLWSWTRCLPKI